MPVLKIKKDGEWLEVAGASNHAQPDWNQNDSTAQDYIKNRPFYTETTTETEIFDIIQIANDFGGEWKAETSEESVTGKQSFTLGFYGADLPISFVIGNEYQITVNGVSYTSSAVDFGGMVGYPYVMIGDSDAVMSQDFSNFRYAAVIFQPTEGEYDFELILDAETFSLTEAPTELTISGSTVTEVVHQIDKKFLPDDIIPDITVDSELNTASENPVQNKVVTEAIGNLNEDINSLNDNINNLNTLVGDTSVAEQINNAIAEVSHPVTSVNGQTGDVMIEIPEIPEIPEQVQADWEQNEATATNYIQNRPFYSKKADLIYDGELTTTKLSSREVAYGEMDASFMSSLVLGDWCVVDFNGTEYVCQYKKNPESVNDTYYLGNMYMRLHDNDTYTEEETIRYLTTIGLYDTGEPFCIYYTDTCTKDEGTYAIKVYKLEVSQIHEMYIPQSHDALAKSLKVYYEWNDNIEYPEVVEHHNLDALCANFAKISDDTPTPDFFIGKYLSVLVGDSRGIYESGILLCSSDINIENSVYSVSGGAIIVVTADTYDLDGIVLTKGVWACNDYNRLNGLYYLKWRITDFCNGIDESVIPLDIARISDIPTIPEINYPVTSVNGMTGDVVIEATKVEVDPTLSIEGQAADAKSVGDAIKAMNHIVATDDGNGIITLSLSPLTPADEEVF